MKKNILIALLAIFACSCENNSIESKTQKQKFEEKYHLKENQIFLHTYGYGTERLTYKGHNDNGIFFTMKEWSYSEMQFRSYEDLLKDEAFYILNEYDNRGMPKESKENPLKSLKILDMFKMNYGSSVRTFIIKDINNNGLVCTTTEWLWDSSVFIEWGDYDGKYFKNLHKKYR